MVCGNHDDDKFPKFQAKYLEELQTGSQKEALNELKKVLTKEKDVTLVYGAKNEESNNAQVLYQLLKDEI